MAVALASSLVASCGSSGSSMSPTGQSGVSTPTPTPAATPTPTPTPTPFTSIANDTHFFELLTRTEPFSAYRLFPNTDEFTSGRLNGSEAHQPIVRVTLNRPAFDVLVNGKLPAGREFPDGSIVFKEVKPNASAEATLYAVMRKEKNGPLARNGWVWAEYRPNGAVAYSVTRGGGVCVGCHALEQGAFNDLVRTFERQR